MAAPSPWGVAGDAVYVVPMVAVRGPGGRRTGEGSRGYLAGAGAPRNYCRGSSAGTVRTTDAAVRTGA
ncbi:hypothetical protein [Streptomyces aureoverticillatus]|uniref:hypothetical protein n=1 Tax=Streptomyces aureoverticillatus TaxID=66871 RepID=UPI0013DB6B3B|nr:hypothetical protein [Streptomyces aureoverticillatus]QIB42714.1 hypothetical protein G3H79_06165 [Streptomyces aureoverticillatus]